MNSYQRVIKYVAMGFAVLLTVIIISSIVNAATFAFGLVSGNIFASNNEEELIDFSQTFTDIKKIDIEIDFGELIIKEGTTFAVEAVNVRSDFKATVSNNGTLVIKEKTSWNKAFNFLDWGNNTDRIKVILYLPQNYVAENVRIDSGACNIDIESLNTDKLIINAGAGNIEGQNMQVDKLELDGGTGNIIFTDVTLEGVDINCGVGNLKIEGELNGRNEIDSGVGNMKLRIKADVEDYDLDIDAGVGSIRLNGEKVKNYNMRGKSAKHYLEIDGGVGNITLDFLN